jgi:hypothetical protein
VRADARTPPPHLLSHKEAGDRLAEEASFALATNDPSGFR